MVHRGTSCPIHVKNNNNVSQFKKMENMYNNLVSFELHAHVRVYRNTSVSLGERQKLSAVGTRVFPQHF